MKMSESEEIPAAPDSTTKEQRLGFSDGEDVLLHKDGKYYLGTVVEVDLARERCLIKFMDNTSSWSLFKDLTKLAMPESDVMCVLCKKSQPKTDNEIVVCDKCGRGYHQLCHQPRITKGQVNPEAHWKCKKCLDGQPRMREIGEPKNSMVKANIRKVCSGRDQPPPPPEDRTKLPYNPELLNWDAHHRVNAEQIYCYCGLNGEWYTQMLQCARCKQWFHEKCVSCLKYPLYSGDRFYVFVCSMCNYGKEFVRRLELKWVDLVHLMLYNLTVYNAKKYYDLDSVIIPYANQNWANLQLPSRIQHVTPRVRRETILSILTNNRSRFKCGREIKKRTTIWGLRTRLPPPSPVITLPAAGPIDDSILQRIWGSNKRLQYLLPDAESTLEVDSTNQDNAEQEVMIIDVKNEPSVDSSEMAMRGITEQDSNVDQNTCSLSNQSSTQSLRERYSGGGYVKKSFPFPKLSLQRRRRLIALGNSRERMLRNYKMRERGQCDVSSRLQGAREARFRKARKLLKSTKVKNKGQEIDDVEEVTVTTDIVETLQIKTEIEHVESMRNMDVAVEPGDLPPTPPTSVSDPPTPSATVSALSEISMSSSVEMTHLLPPSTPADTSGDETSSRGTLDSFIPPPKDFEGKNNPFRNLSELLGAPCGSGQASSSGSSTSNPSPITLPLPLTPVIYGNYPPPIARPAKRQLSEKDIIIDRNGQVKRRRTHRRGRPPSQHYTASKTAAIMPARTNEVNKGELIRKLRSSFSSSSSSNHIDDIDFHLNGRRLRQRQSNEKPLPIEPASQLKMNAPPSPKCSPIKQNTPEISMNKLKSSVNVYFGAANRIASGEKFTIKGKRVSPSGQEQYLIEWEGPNP